MSAAIVVRPIRFATLMVVVTGIRLVYSSFVASTVVVNLFVVSSYRWRRRVTFHLIWLPKSFSPRPNSKLFQ